MTNPLNPLSGLAASIANLAELWELKASLGTLMGLVCAYIGADAVLVWLLILAMCMDFVLGITDAIHRHCFRCRALERGALKVVYYSVYLGVVAIMNASLSHAVMVQLPLLNLFISYLTLTEVVSITGHLLTLGWPVPAVLLSILARTKKGVAARMEQRLDSALGIDEDDPAAAPEPKKDDRDADI